MYAVEVDVDHCPNLAAEIIAAIDEPVVIVQIVPTLNLPAMKWGGVE